ncbi:citrate lyase holo-[acyl-carrier protein] synthase [Lactobacillus sp. ESL0791]|uniref:citrate lyase holo-[acyl-carrier protein] synthase n=1 Tax=Lactobacillus sp. ESL0791 TaxID=2983234 RepID=UPI0023F84609|nr:citrate lyase holo-[acyl-carrier protein] synthase [Lactobacillus sp. ESL0791]MDF7638986.1 citrate lyase holo-[acyl-carrier protein] synthase [Lactobacillus sp. ESL0791]
MQTIFNEGKKQTIADVLACKDKRVATQQAIFKQYPEQVLVDVKMNIPGPIKNNHYLARLFTKGIGDLVKICQQKKLHYRLLKANNEDSGSENFYLFKDDVLKVKRAMIAFEDKSRLGRIFDADVLQKNRRGAVSRSELNYSVRKCFLCDRPAKECARSRRHSVAELQNYLSQMYNKEF